MDKTFSFKIILSNLLCNIDGVVVCTLPLCKFVITVDGWACKKEIHV